MIFKIYYNSIARSGDVMMQYTQAEFLQLIQQYNSTDRKIIKANLKRIMHMYGIKPANIMSLIYSHMCVCPDNKSTKNIPLLNK